MKYQLLIFDLDGTILDTLEDLCDSTNYALTINGFPARSITEVRSFVGNGIRKLIERAVPDGTDSELLDKVYVDFSQHYKAHCADKTRPYDGILELLARLKEEGYQTAVVSNKADFAVQSLCKDYFPDIFDFVVGEREGIRRKPYPDSVNEVMTRLQTVKENTLYIGDSEVDLQTAKNAGIDSVAVTWGFRDKEYLKEQGASVLVDRPVELQQWIGLV